MKSEVLKKVMLVALLVISFSIGLEWGSDGIWAVALLMIAGYWGYKWLDKPKEESQENQTLIQDKVKEVGKLPKWKLITIGVIVATSITLFLILDWSTIITTINTWLLGISAIIFIGVIIYWLTKIIFGPDVTTRSTYYKDKDGNTIKETQVWRNKRRKK